MASRPFARKALRSSRPEPESFFTIMVVFSHRTFRWSVARRTLIWSVGIALGVWAVAMMGSAYGFWANRKLMDFGSLQQEAAQQQRQLRESLDQARDLESQVKDLHAMLSSLMQTLDPKAPSPDLPPVPNQGGGKPPLGPGRLSQLQRDLTRLSEQSQAIRSRMEPIIDRWNHTPSIPPTAGYLSSGYGIRIRPFSRVNEEDEGLLGFHKGFDITNQEGTHIMATADGTVVFAGIQAKYGLVVVVRHSDEFETLYAHMSRFFVREGQKVGRGDIIGAMGRSGNATGVHLHYEVHRNGSPVNPQPYLRLQKQWLSNLH